MVLFCCDGCGFLRKNKIKKFIWTQRRGCYQNKIEISLLWYKWLDRPLAPRRKSLQLCYQEQSKQSYCCKYWVLNNTWLLQIDRSWRRAVKQTVQSVWSWFDVLWTHELGFSWACIMFFRRSIRHASHLLYRSCHGIEELGFWKDLSVPDDRRHKNTIRWVRNSKYSFTLPLIFRVKRSFKRPMPSLLTKSWKILQ